MKEKEINGAKRYTPATKFENIEKCTRKLWNFIVIDKICGHCPTLQEISIYNQSHFTKQRNFGAKTLIELQKILEIAGLEITNEQED